MFAPGDTMKIHNQTSRRHIPSENKLLVTAMSAPGPIGISWSSKTNRRNVTSRKIWIFVKTVVITIGSCSLLVYGEA